jgi:hypothetical protein
MEPLLLPSISGFERQPELKDSYRLDLLGAGSRVTAIVAVSLPFGSFQSRGTEMLAHSKPLPQADH